MTIIARRAAWRAGSWQPRAAGAAEQLGLGHARDVEAAHLRLIVAAADRRLEHLLEAAEDRFAHELVADRAFFFDLPGCAVARRRVAGRRCALRRTRLRRP